MPEHRRAVAGARSILTAALLSAGLVLAACGDERMRNASPAAMDSPASAVAQVAELERCPETAWAKGGGTDWEVSAGMSCEAVGEFVFKHFAPHPGATTQAAAGFTCDVEQDGSQYAPLRVACAAADGRRFRFVFH